MIPSHSEGDPDLADYWTRISKALSIVIRFTLPRSCPLFNVSSRPVPWLRVTRAGSSVQVTIRLSFAIYEARAVAARARSSAGPMLSTLSTGFSFKFNLTPVQSPGRLRPFLSL
jgi:hypothetical protein